MQVTCPGCAMSYSADSAQARCPACGAGAPGGGAYAQAGFGSAGGSFGAAPYAPGFAGQGYAQQAPPMGAELIVPTNLVIWSVICAIICQPAGIVSFVLMDQAKTLHRAGNFDGAQQKLATARKSLWIGAGIALVLIAAYVLFIAIVVVSATRHHR